MLQWLKHHKWYALVVGLVAGSLLYAQLHRGVHEVEVTEAREGPLLLRIAASGIVEAESSDLAFRGSGEIAALYIAEGEPFSESQVLGRIARIGPQTGIRDAGDVIIAPYDGTVVDVYLREGTVVTAGPPVLRAASSRAPWVTAFIDGEDAMYVSPGDRFTCRVGGYLSEPWEVEVSAVGSEAVPRRDLPGSARQVRVKCEIAPGAPSVPPGTEVDVDGDVRIVDWGVLVPASAVVHEGPEDWVWVLEGETVRRQPVVLGPNNFDEIEISEGLASGETVVVRGKTGLDEGMEVKSKPPAPMGSTAGGA